MSEKEVKVHKVVCLYSIFINRIKTINILDKLKPFYDFDLNYCRMHGLIVLMLNQNITK